MLWGMRRGKCTGRRSVKASVASIGAQAKPTMEPPMRKPKRRKPFNDLSRSPTALNVNETLIAVVDNASTYCAPFYVIRTPGFFGRDLMLAHGAARSSTDPEQQELTFF